METWRCRRDEGSNLAIHGVNWEHVSLEGDEENHGWMDASCTCPRRKGMDLDVTCTTTTLLE
jgi:hypothetical protein